MESSINLVKKPAPLRVLFILNALMMILPFIFYFVITSKGIDVGGLNPVVMVYTGIGYILSFALVVYSILKKNLTLLRIIIAVNILIALPAKAYIGIGVAIISILLTMNNKVLAYFNS